MSEYMAKAGYHTPIAQSICFTSGYSLQKIWGDILMYRLFRALNTVTFHNSFPLPHIEEALQTVKSAMWFTSFNLAQGYLQLSMDEADIHKTAICAVHSYAFQSVYCGC